MAYNTFEGSKYNRDHSRAERKAAILAHLKTLIPPGSRVTLKEGSGVGTMSLTATVANLPFGIFDVESMHPAFTGRNRHSEKFSALMKLLTDEAEQFGFDHSEIESDYFSRAFYFGARVNAEESEAEKQAILAAGSNKRAEIAAAIETAVGRYNEVLVAAGKKPFSKTWMAPMKIAAEIDAATQSDFASLIASLEADLAAAEDWNVEAALTAQTSFVSAKKVPSAKKPKPPKPPTDKQIKKRIEAAYYRFCAGVQINLLDIPKVFAEGRKIVATGATDAELGRQLVAFVATIRVDARMDRVAMENALASEVR